MLMQVEKARFTKLRLVELYILISCVVIANMMILSTGDTGHNNNVMIGRGFDSLAIIIGTILFFSLSMCRHLRADEERFMLVILFNTIVLTFDTASWYVNGNLNYTLHNEWFRYAKNIGMMISNLIFWDFLIHYTKIEPATRKVLWTIILFVTLVGATMVFADIFTDWLFSIDENGYYVRGSHMYPFYIISTIPPIITAGIVLKYHQRMREKVAIVSYLAILLIFLTVQYYNPGLSLIYTAPLISCVIIYTNFYVTENERLMLRESEIKKEKFDAMMTQIQPHFLYNALTSIMSIKGNPPETQDAIVDFANYLRTNLDSVEKNHPIPFPNELDHVKLYIDLEKLRFKDSFEVEIDVRDWKFLIPALSLQMLVESAVFHGVTMRQGKGKVIIRTEEVPGGHQITVIDTGDSLDSSGSLDSERRAKSIMLVRQRLAKEVNGTLHITCKPGEGTTAVVFIPTRKISSVKDI